MEPSTRQDKLIKDRATIRERVLYCSKLFEQAQAEASEIQNARKRFVEWYTNIAAHRAGTASLDERLRDAPDVRATVLQFLDALVTALKYGSSQSPDVNHSSKLNQAIENLVDLATISKPSSLMHKVVESLKRISIAIRTPASVDRYEKAKKVNIDHFFPTDKSHIEELFQKADPVLRDRLLQAVLSRRKFLRYAREHKERLAKEVAFPQDEETDEMLFAEEKSEFADTVATPFSPVNFMDDIIPTGIFDGDSDGAASDISSSSSLRSDMSIRVPPMPSMCQEGKPFECPCCFLMIEARNREEWKRHVFSDMRPYVCTFTDCKEPDRLFPSRHDWYSHELAFHRRMWICIWDCSKQFASESDFKAHLSVNHKEFKDIAQAEKRGAHSRQLPEPKTSTCPMCRDEIRYPELIRTHVGRHQAQLGLWPLHSMGYFDEEDDQEGDEEDEEDSAKMSDEEEKDGQEAQEEGEAMKVEDGMDEGGKKREDDETKVLGNPAPSQDAAGSDSPPPGSTETWLSLGREDYTIAWICATPAELAAAVACLDARHKAVQPIPRDGNCYQFGQIDSHHIVIGCPGAGKDLLVSVAHLETKMKNNFPRIRLGVSVGIGSGVPSNHGIRLGDVAVGLSGSSLFNSNPYLDGLVRPLQRSIDPPPRYVFDAVEQLLAHASMEGLGLERDMQSILARNPQLCDDYSRPDSSSDRLYVPSYTHASNGPCELSCDPQYEIRRPERNENHDNPYTHYGLIISATVPRAVVNDRKVIEDEKIICFEMEAAALQGRFPFILIRGICDYGDTHNSTQWQCYAAMSAAVYARALLRFIPPRDRRQIPVLPLFLYGA